MKVAIIGAGTMGSAFARILLKRQVTFPADLLLVEQSEAQLSVLGQELGCRVSDEIGPEIGGVDLVLLAVKPQDFKSVANKIVKVLHANQIVLSIMAGVSIATLGELLSGHRQLIRCMPNMASQIGQGMSVYFSTLAVSEADRASVHSLLSATGEVLEVNSEDLIDAATAISGSGPAYIFYFIEQLTLAALSLGFEVNQATKLVCTTVEGSLALLRRGPESAQELRNKVTSKGGTTAAALNVFQEKQVGLAIEAAVRAAYVRARELSKA